MKFELSDLTNFFGRDNSECKGHLYSVILEMRKIRNLSNFLQKTKPFIMKVAALRQGQLRLYIYYHDRTAIIVGSGGYKPPEIHAYQEDPNLNAKADLMKRIAKAIANAIIERDLSFLEDGSIETTDFLDLEI